MPSDIEIARGIPMKPIHEVGKTIGLSEDDLDLYGKYKAKISFDAVRRTEDNKDGKLILVTAITPTPAGEGKTTMSVGLADGLSLLGKKTILALREPSLGPVFGLKGGAAGGGYSQVVPMEDINLHFTGDLHAITAANNLLCAMLDNHIQQGNKLGVDPRRVVIKRALDMNDRQLRSITSGLGGKPNGMPREDGFEITVASEVMAIFCLASSLSDLKDRLSNILVAHSFLGDPVTAGDLKAEGAMTALLRDALRPNLVQTLKHTPAIVHGGPFANIAHGCNSVIATKFALKNADYVVTEAGFGADLGAEKFVDIKCRLAGLGPSAAVIVATVRALKHHGEGDDLLALERGFDNLKRHIKNVKEVYGIPAIVALNRFTNDTDEELALVAKLTAACGVDAIPSDVWAKGGEGARDLAKKVTELTEAGPSLRFVYPSDLPLVDKVIAVARDVYGARGVVFSDAARRDLLKLQNDGYGTFPVCIAKTQYSFTDDPKKINAPADFDLHVSRVKLSRGAGFVVIYTGDVMTMPGLPKVPAAEAIDVDGDGNIQGLF